ncbi:MAG: hypothetical protein HN576_11830 [Bacteriovoracaceae bacterium]|jgi:hypothetical protein|nr:hypothetical protein [Bacteriovoracaceae bacterium]
MQRRMKAMIPCGDKEIIVDLFGYTTKGIPGLEIIGMGKNSRQLKEKLIFLSRQQPEGLPLSRFVLCLDENLNTAQLKENQLRWLEIPFLILFWSLARLVPLENLENCYSSGTIGVSGIMTLRSPALENIPPVRSIYIGHHSQAIPHDWLHISLDEIFLNRPGFYIDNFFANSS